MKTYFEFVDSHHPLFFIKMYVSLVGAVFDTKELFEHSSLLRWRLQGAEGQGTRLGSAEYGRLTFLKRLKGE